MGFEDRLFEIVRKKADIKRRRFILKHGSSIKEDQFLRNAYREIYEPVTKNAIRGFTKRINCGGYALEIDGCFFPNGDTLSGYVSAILDRYKFIRLLGDTPLQDDEYLVFYRFQDCEGKNDRNDGHHFIKVNDDGLVVEKCGAEVPQIFEGWHYSYEESPEVTFAVKKSHNSEFDYELEGLFHWLEIEKGLDFEGSVLRSILQKSNEFEYHNHSFRLKKSTEEELFVTDDKGEIVADVLVEGEDIVVEIREGKEEYVENFSGPIKPIIENGRLVNLDEFKRKDRER